MGMRFLAIILCLSFAAMGLTGCGSNNDNQTVPWSSSVPCYPGQPCLQPGGVLPPGTVAPLPAPVMMGPVQLSGNLYNINSSWAQRIVSAMQSLQCAAMTGGICFGNKANNYNTGYINLTSNMPSMAGNLTYQVNMSIGGLPGYGVGPNPQQPWNPLGMSGSSLSGAGTYYPQNQGPGTSGSPGSQIIFQQYGWRFNIISTNGAMDGSVSYLPGVQIQVNGTNFATADLSLSSYGGYGPVPYPGSLPIPMALKQKTAPAHQVRHN